MEQIIIKNLKLACGKWRCFPDLLLGIPTKRIKEASECIRSLCKENIIETKIVKLPKVPRGPTSFKMYRYNIFHRSNLKPKLKVVT